MLSSWWHHYLWHLFRSPSWCHVNNSSPSGWHVNNSSTCRRSVSLQTKEHEKVIHEVSPTVCGGHSSQAWWRESSLRWHRKCSASDACERSGRLDGRARETTHTERFCEMKGRWSQWRRDVRCLTTRTHSECRRKQWFMLHPTKTAKTLSPPLLFRHPGSFYLWFGFRCLFSCCPNWSSSSCCEPACCCGNHPRLSSHDGSWWSVLQRVDHLPLLQLIYVCLWQLLMCLLFHDKVKWTVKGAVHRLYTHVSLLDMRSNIQPVKTAG